MQGYRVRFVWIIIKGVLPGGVLTDSYNRLSQTDKNSHLDSRRESQALCRSLGGCYTTVDNRIRHRISPCSRKNDKFGQG